jgi:hypothetical protein
VDLRFDLEGDCDNSNVAPTATATFEQAGTEEGGAEMTQGHKASSERAERAKAFLVAVRTIVGPQWSPEGASDDDPGRRQAAKLAFIDRADALGAWLYKQSPPTSGKDAMAWLRANVERYAKAVHGSTLTLRKYTPEACLEWLRNNGLASTKPAPKTLPPLDVSAPSKPKVTVVNLERAAEQRRLAAEAIRAMSEASGRGPVGPRKAREPFAPPELEGAAQ